MGCGNGFTILKHNQLAWSSPTSSSQTPNSICKLLSSNCVLGVDAWKTSPFLQVSSIFPLTYWELVITHGDFATSLASSIRSNIPHTKKETFFFIVSLWVSKWLLICIQVEVQNPYGELLPHQQPNGQSFSNGHSDWYQVCNVFGS